MTLAFAKARGFARPQKARVNKWAAVCPNCQDYGLPLGTKGEASRAARQHNAAVHAPSRVAA